jgi:hypothetical protein
MSHYGIVGATENNAEKWSSPALPLCVALKNGACHIPALWASTPCCDYFRALVVNAVSGVKSRSFTALSAHRAL